MVDGALPPGLRIMLDGRQLVSAPVQADGRFSLAGRVQGDSVSVTIDVADGNRNTLPALIRLPTASATTNLRVVLVPVRWTIEGGAHHGTTVSISMDAAFRAPCDRPGDTNCDGFFPASWTNGIKIWPTTTLPARLAFDHTRSHLGITAADSVHFWNVVGRLNADAGIPLFRPARSDEIILNTAGSPTNGVLIRVDTTLAGFGAWANWWWNASGEMYAGLVRPRNINALRNGSLMTHELLHTQGVKHSCSWETVMGGYGCGSTPGISAHDVAYFQLARRIHDAQRAHGAPHGLVAALHGERVVLRGLSPAHLPAAARLQLMMSDSIGEPLGDSAGHRH
jgi:hypothetical protein